LVIDSVDADSAPRIESLGIKTMATDTVMKTDDDKTRLARETLNFARSLKSRLTE